MKKLALALFTAVMLTGCCIENPLLIPSKELHKSAHRELMHKYIPNDESLSPEEKKLRIDSLKSYGELLQEIEGK